MTPDLSLSSASPSSIPRRFRAALESPLGSRISRGAFWSLVGAALSRSLGLLAAIASARLIGKAGFGELGVIQNTVNTFQVFAGFGLGVTATKYVAQLRYNNPIRTGRILRLSALTALITGVLVSCALFLCAPLLATTALAAPHLAAALRIGAGLLFFAALNGAQLGALAGLEKFKIIARVNLYSGILTFMFTVAGALYAGLTGILWATLASAGVAWLITEHSLRDCLRSTGVPTRVSGCWQEWRVLWAFSLPAVLAGVASAAAIWATGAILVNQPGGYPEMGAYNAVLRIKQVPEVALTAILAPILPILSGAYGQKDRSAYNRAARYAFALSLALLLPAALLQIAMPELSLLAFGRDFSGNAPIVRWLMVQTAILGVFSPFGTIQISMGRMWLGAIYNVSWAIAFIMTALWLVPRYQGAGLAASSCAAYVITVAPTVVYLYKKEGEYLTSTPVWQLLTTFLCMMAICWIAGATCPRAVAVLATAISIGITIQIVLKLAKTGW